MCGDGNSMAIMLDHRSTALGNFGLLIVQFSKGNRHWKAVSLSSNVEQSGIIYYVGALIRDNMVNCFVSKLLSRS